MTAQQPAPAHQQRCVLTMHEVSVIKDLIFVISGNAESSSQKVIFEMLADGIRKASSSRPASEPAPASVVQDGDGYIEKQPVETQVHTMRTMEKHDARIRKDERGRAMNEFMKAIDWRFNDTEKGRIIIKTIQEIKDNLNTDAYPDVDGLQDFPFRSSMQVKKP